MELWYERLGILKISLIGQECQMIKCLVIIKVIMSFGEIIEGLVYTDDSKLSNKAHPPHLYLK